MNPADLQTLSDFTYGDVVDQSIAHLDRLRDGYRQCDLSGEVPPEFPTHIQVQTIGGCNARCGMCPISDPEIRSYQRGRMPMELFNRIVEEAAGERSCRVISPYLQNEPLLDKDLAARVRCIKDRSDGRLSARIVTNASLLDARRIDELLAAGIDVISISLNAHTERVYERVMPGLSFARTRANVETLLERDLRSVLVILTFMVTSDNEHEIEEAVDYWSSRGVLCGAFGIGTMTGNVPQFEALKGASFKARPKECFVPLESATILANGDFLLCCSDWARAACYGNVKATRIRDVWHSEPLAAIRRDAISGVFDHPICQKCLGQTKLPQNLVYSGGPGRMYHA